MINFFKTIFFLALFFSTNIVFAQFSLEKRLVDNSIIHILIIDPNDYKIELVKANDGNKGRETVPDMAKRKQAQIAINGGFFEMGGDRDGIPSGTLVIKGKPYHLNKKIQSLLIINQNKLTITKDLPKNRMDQNISMVSGIPLLIEEGKIVKDVLSKTSDFYVKPHARTAIGLKANGEIVIVVAENYYGVLGGIQGLSITSLATLMQQLGCGSALNLDGGGSSTLWVNGKVINRTIGDLDESEGDYSVRAVSDSIVFI
ncbi:MAG: phosphodiester glycosidase family protein [Candidatus Berkiellales bacterium]